MPHGPLAQSALSTVPTRPLAQVTWSTTSSPVPAVQPATPVTRWNLSTHSSRWPQAARGGRDEGGDLGLVHLRQPCPPPLPLALVAVGELVEDAAVLRVEEHEREGVDRQGAEQLEPVGHVGRVEA